MLKKKKKDGNRVSEDTDLRKVDEAAKTAVCLNVPRCKQSKEPPRHPSTPTQVTDFNRCNTKELLITKCYLKKENYLNDKVTSKNRMITEKKN